MRTWAMVPRSVTLRYLMPDGRKIDCGRRFVFCRDCDGISEAESFPFQSDVEAEIQEAKISKNRLVRLFMHLRGTLQKAEERRDAAITRRDFLEMRKSAPRCLKCGGVHLASLDSQGEVHSCGGNLTRFAVDEQAPRFHYTPEVIELLVEGRRP